MAHTRHRKFNTRDTCPEQTLDNDLAQAVVARGTMNFLRGQLSQTLQWSGRARCAGDSVSGAFRGLIEAGLCDGATTVLTHSAFWVMVCSGSANAIASC